MQISFLLLGAQHAGCAAAKLYLHINSACSQTQVTMLLQRTPKQRSNPMLAKMKATFSSSGCLRIISAAVSSLQQCAPLGGWHLLRI